jgi:hypothetical protein
MNILGCGPMLCTALTNSWYICHIFSAIDNYIYIYSNPAERDDTVVEIDPFTAV